MRMDQRAEWAQHPMAALAATPMFALPSVAMAALLSAVLAHGPGMTMRIGGLGRGLLAISSVAIAALSLSYAHLEWQSLPAWLPWREAWVYGWAVILLGASAGLCFPRLALPGVLTIGVYHFVAAAIAVPLIVAEPISIGAWYLFCEPATALAAAWLLYSVLRLESPEPETPLVGAGTVQAAKVLFALTCIFYGLSHFVYADYTASLVPAWLPGRLAFAYLTGIGHVAAGVAIIVGILPGVAAILEAIMMSLFGLLVWVPSFFMQPRPAWAVPPEKQWSELVATLSLAASAWLIAICLRKIRRRPTNRR